MDFNEFDVSKVVDEQESKKELTQQPLQETTQSKPKQNMLLAMANNPMVMGVAKSLPLKIKIIIGLALVLLIIGVVTVCNWIFALGIAFPITSCVVVGVILVGVTVLDIMAKIKKKKIEKKIKEEIANNQIIGEIPQEESALLTVVKSINEERKDNK